MLLDELHYKINNEVIFYPQQGVLKNMNNAQEVKLGLPVSSCLLLLIEHHGSIVTQDKFIERIWTARKIIVSANTLVKNISHLRQCLSQAGCQYDIIRTIKSQGYLIPKAFPVTFSDIHALPKSDDTHDIVLNAAAETIAAPPHKVTMPLRRKIIFALLIAVIMSISITVVKFAMLNDNVNSPRGYNYYRISDGCKVFFNRDSNSHKEQILELIKKRENYDCNDAPYLYITAYKEVHNYSLYQCINPIEKTDRDNMCYTTVRFNYRDVHVENKTKNN